MIQFMFCILRNDIGSTENALHIFDMITQNGINVLHVKEQSISENKGTRCCF